MKKHEHRISKLEGIMAGMRPGVASSDAARQKADLAATRRRCELLLEVLDADESAKRDQLIQTIASIDNGTYVLPSRLPASYDERARVMRGRLLEALGTQGA